METIRRAAESPPSADRAHVRPISFGVFGLNAFARRATFIDLACRVESAGLDSVWMGEHMVYPTAPGLGLTSPDEPVMDPLVALAMVTAVAPTLRLGTGVLVVPQRHPVHLAKEIATLDRLSDGQLTVGVGVGYLTDELAALDVEPTTRGRRADEALDVMRTLWTNATAGFDGRWFSFAGVDAHPTPVQRGGPPIIAGGHSAAAYARAARFDGWYGFSASPEVVEIAMREIRCRRDENRQEPYVVVTPPVPITPALVDAYQRLGVAEIVVWPRTTDPDAWRRVVDDTAAVAQAMRGKRVGGRSEGHRSTPARTDGSQASERGGTS